MELEQYLSEKFKLFEGKDLEEKKLSQAEIEDEEDTPPVQKIKRPVKGGKIRKGEKFGEDYAPFIQKANRFFGETFIESEEAPEKRTITTTYEIISEESAENGDVEESGYKDEEGEPIELDESDIEEGLTIVDKAVKFLEDKGSLEPSSWPTWHSGVWYTQSDGSTDYNTGNVTIESYHLNGFTDEEEREIYKRITGK